VRPYGVSTLEALLCRRPKPPPFFPRPTPRRGGFPFPSGMEGEAGKVPYHSPSRPSCHSRVTSSQKARPAKLPNGA
jgi:hypothetical protein